MIGKLSKRALDGASDIKDRGRAAASGAIEMTSDLAGGVTQSISSTLSGLREIKVLPTYDLPVYLVHNSFSADDYDLLFDWETYLTQAKGKTIARPAFKIYSGRSEFDRKLFATRFRQQFEEEYAYLISKKEDQQAKKKPPSIPNVSMGFEFWLEASVFVILTGGLGLVPLITLWMGLGTANTVIDEVNGLIAKAASISLNPLKGKKDKIDVDAKKAEVDRALQSIEVANHPDLMVNAYGPNGILGYPDIRKEYERLPSEWPLPAFVNSRLEFTQKDILPAVGKS